jgi:nitronate monooxygenase
VVAAGGIGSARGLAAVLAAGAEGAWIGTGFLATHEAANTPEARKRILAARETETILTHAFDRAQGLAWPERYPGRALHNAFTERWHEREWELADHPEAVEQLTRAQEERNYDVANIYAGEVIGLVGQERPAGAVVHDLGRGAEVLLRRRYETLLS